MGNDMSDNLCLVLDIGGTNTRIALTQRHTLLTDRVQKYANADYPDLAAVIETYLGDQNAGALDRVCVAAAGPVTDDRAEMTNLNWVIDARDISSFTGSAKVSVINDLQAQGHSLHMLAVSYTHLTLPTKRIV